MAQVTANEPDLEGTREARNGEVGQGAVKNGDGKAEKVSSSHGSKAENVQTGQKADDAKEEKPNPSKFKQMFGKLGLDMGTVMMMFKLVCLQKSERTKLIKGKELSSSSHR
jgi:predicted lipid-binding transport protein (Tim44 family)